MDRLDTTLEERSGKLGDYLDSIHLNRYYVTVVFRQNGLENYGALKRRKNQDTVC